MSRYCWLNEYNTYYAVTLLMYVSNNDFQRGPNLKKDPINASCFEGRTGKFDNTIQCIPFRPTNQTILRQIVDFYLYREIHSTRVVTAVRWMKERCRLL